ncbi:MAG: UDP-glucose 4-epimerase GalE [Magnetospirillum sp.]|nr:UDP-glucose 4-epimerase GalE [Magnetospirillum sp.]
MTDTVLVTGGAGYLGSHTILALVEAGHRVVVVDDFSTGSRAALPAGIAVIEADIADGDRMVETMRAHDVAAVIHFAGSISVAESVREPLRYWHNNTEGTLAVARACVAAGIGHLVFSSTAAVYGEGDGGRVAEDAPTMPVNPYGRSKLAAEWLLKDIAAVHPLSCVILRYFNVAGADPAGRTGQRAGKAGAGPTHLIRAACLAALGVRPALEVYGTDYPTRDGTAERDFIHVADLADAHVAALAYLRRGGRTVVLNVGYGRGHTVREVAAAVERVQGRPLAMVERPRRPGDAAAVVADAGRIRTSLGWQPRYDALDTIVADTLAWEARLAETGGPAGPEPTRFGDWEKGGRCSDF